MADVTQLRFAQGLKKLLGLKGPDTGRVVVPGITPSFEIADTYRPEMRAVRGERLCSFATNLNNVAATSFQRLHMIAPLGGRVFVLRRVTWSFLMPTQPNFPGIQYMYVGTPAPNVTPFVSTVFGQYKDSRNVTGAINQTSTGYLPFTVGAVAAGTIFNASVYFENIQPQATTGPFRVQVPDLDIVLTPGNFLDVGIGSDTLPVGSFSYFVCLEGYEYVPDNSELIAPLT